MSRKLPKAPTKTFAVDLQKETPFGGFKIPPGKYWITLIPPKEKIGI